MRRQEDLLSLADDMANTVLQGTLVAEKETSVNVRAIVERENRKGL